GLPAGEAVGTAFVFAGFVRLVAAPFYLFSRQIHSRYFWLLLRGAVPGLLSGTLVLRFVTARGGNSTVVILLGVVLALTAALHFARSEEHTSELQSRFDLVCRLLLEKKK